MAPLSIRLAHSSFLVVVLMIWLVAVAGYLISKNSLQELTVERVKYAGQQRAELYSKIWESALYAELSQLQAVVSSPVVVQGVVQPETHLEALRQTLVAAFRKKTQITATIVDYEGNPLVEIGQGTKLYGMDSEPLTEILDGSHDSDIRFIEIDGTGSVQLMVPILRHALDKSWVEGVLITREPIRNIHSQMRPKHNHSGDRLVLVSGSNELFSVGSTHNSEELPIEVEVASASFTLQYYAQLGLEKSLLIDRLSVLALKIGAALTIGMGIGYFLIDRLLHHPLASFMEAIEGSKGNGSPIPIQSVSRISEIRQMTDRYNEMMKEISERQEELKSLNNSLRVKVVSQAQEIATMHAAREKMKFLSGVSHELRTPLHAILGFTRLGLEKSQAEELPAIERYFSKVDRNASALLTIVDDVLDLTKTRSNVETESMSATCLFSIVREVVEEMEAFIAEAFVKVRIINKHPDLYVNVDSSRMQQVIRNLLSNAVRYSPAGSDVVIEIVKLVNQCEVRILDRGVGIPPDELESIFDAFTQSSRTDKLAGGTGLGLAISRAILSNHGGTLEATNRIDGGACFTFILPIWSGENLAAA